MEEIFPWLSEKKNFLLPPNDTSEHLRIDDIRRAGDLTLAWWRSLTADDVA